MLLYEGVFSKRHFFVWF